MKKSDALDILEKGLLKLALKKFKDL